MSSLAIIVPCYNEAKRLEADKFVSFAPAHADCHFYFVNDGSTDRTLTVLHTLEQQANNIFVIDKKQNDGKGEAIRTAMLQLVDNYEYIGYIDADLSTSLEEFYNLFEKIKKEKISVVFGSRIKKADTVIERSYFRHIIGRSIATIIDKKFSLGCYDTQCGAKVFASGVLKPVIEKTFYTKWFFDVELFVRIKNYFGQLNAIETPLAEWKNVKDSKLNALSFPAVSKELYLLLTKY